MGKETLQLGNIKTYLIDPLNRMINELYNIGYTGGSFSGLAQPADNPSPTQPTFWLAGPGTYTNFGGEVISANKIGFITYDGSAYSSLEVDVDTTIDDSGLSGYLTGITTLQGLADKLDTLDLSSKADQVDFTALEAEVAGKVNKTDEFGNFNLNTNYRWQDGVTDIGNTFQAYFSANIPTVEDNTVFDYAGRCAKGCIIQTRCYLGNFTLSDIPNYIKILKIVLEVYIPAATSVTFSLYVYNPSETGISNAGKTLSVEGVNRYEFELDITGYTTLTRIGIYALSGSGDLVNVRFGRFYLGNKNPGSLDGDNQELEYRIGENLESYDNELKTDYFSSNNFKSKISDYYTKPEQFIDNEAYLIFDFFDEIKFGRLTKLSLNPQKEIYDFPNDFPLPFTKGVRLSFQSQLTNTSYLNIAFKTKYRKRFFCSSWIQLWNIGTASNNAFSIELRKGFNNMEVKYIKASVRSNEYSSIIKPAIDNAGVWEYIGIGYIARSSGYLEWNGRIFLHLEYEITEDLPSADYIQVNFGRNDYFVINDNPDLIYFGFQFFEDFYVSQFNGEPPYKSLGRKAISSYIDEKSIEQSKLLDNQIVDCFNLGRNVVLADTGNITINHPGKFSLYSPFGITEKIYHNKFHEGYKITYNGGIAFPKYESHSVQNRIIAYYPETYISASDNAVATIGFWVDRRELNDNGLLYHSGSGGDWYLRPEDLIAKGFAESRVQNIEDEPDPKWVVKEIDGNYTFIEFYLSDEFHLSVYNTSSNDVLSLTLYNPTLLYSRNIDPYHRYLSRPEKNISPWIGKKLMLFGDSQHNDQMLAITLAKELGLVIVDAHHGAHSMKIRSSQLGNANYDSFYHVNLRDVALAHTDIDIYLFTVSTNDGSGGGDSSTSAVQAVLDNYPEFGDDPATVSAKLAIFSGLSNAEVDSIFNYKNTYSAYLKQIQKNYPDARIICTSVPIACTGYLTGADDGNGNGIWKAEYSPDIAYDNLNAGRQQIKLDAIEVANKHNANFVDLLNEVGLSYENYTNYCVDGTHWKSEIKRRMGIRIVNEISKM